MRNLYLLGFISTLFGVSVVASGNKALSRPAPKHTVVYKDVAPTLTRVCGQCHKGAKAADGLDLTSYASVMKGDKKGKVVIAGKPDKSRLATVLHGKPAMMPPGGALPADQIAKVTAWIKAGARVK